MLFLQGFRTIIFNIAATFGAWTGVNYGVEITEEHQMAVCTTSIAVVNILLRLLTNTPIGKKDNKHEK